MYGYEYDARGRLTKITDAMGRIEQYTYDGRSNVATKKDPNGITLTYTYDALDRLEQVSTGVSAIDVTYQYYLTGRLKQEKNDTATLVYKYDSLGRMVSMTDGTFTQTYGYNLSGNTTSALLKQNATTITNIAYTYDKLGRMTAVYDTGVVSPTPTASYTYDANGNRASLTYANGITTTYAYNHANMVTQIKNMAGSTVRSQYDYQYNYDGNQKQKTAVESGVTTTTAYVYDGMGRLTKETQAITGGATTVWDYTYDLRHNRTSMTQGAVTTKYTYDNSNRLTQSSDGTDTTVYTYDANGNQTKVEVNGVTTESYIYNRLNQQTSATKGGVTTAYTYRPDGLRNSKKVGSGAVIKHVYDRGSVIAELNGSTVVNKVVRGIGAIYIDIGGTKSYYLYNAHGDVTQLTNTGGAVTRSYKYDAFGVEINPDVNDANPYRYCAEYFDKETGSIYLRARYYQPKAGRFTQQDGVRARKTNIFDPYNSNYQNTKLTGGLYRAQRKYIIDDPLSLNLYTYCGNNPVFWIDPSGNTIQQLQNFLKENPKAAERGAREATTIDYGFGATKNISVGENRVSISAFNNGFDDNLYIDINGTSHVVGMAAALASPIAVPFLAILGISSGTGVGLPPDGTRASVSNTIDMAVDFLGAGYTEISSGIYRSADGTRQVRFTDNDLEDKRGAHFNFETGETTTDSTGRKSFKASQNSHVYLTDR